MRLLVLTGSVYLVLTGLRLFAGGILRLLSGRCIGCRGCPYGERAPVHRDQSARFLL